MIKHIVMYKLKNPTAENLNALRDKFTAMQGRIPQLISIESGADVLRTNRSFDVVLICEFENLEDMNAYQNNPVHLEVKNYVHSVVAEAKAVDYEFNKE